jgi:hypothetical protein
MPEAAIGSNVVPETFAVQTSVMRAWVFKHRSGKLSLIIIIIYPDAEDITLEWHA